MSKITLAEKTAEQIKELIKKENYTAGMRLPTEKELCASLKVGRNTLREAERILQSHNIVSIRQGSGTYVADSTGVTDDPFNLELVRDRRKLMKDILQMLEIIEPQCAVLAAERRTEMNIFRLEQALDGMKAKIAVGESAIDDECAFYLEMAKASNNLIMERMTPIITDGIRMFDTTLAPIDFKYALRNYNAVLTAIRRGKSNEARLAIEYHLLFLGRQYQLLMHTDEHSANGEEKK